MEKRKFLILIIFLKKTKKKKIPPTPAKYGHTGMDGLSGGQPCQTLYPKLVGAPQTLPMPDWGTFASWNPKPEDLLNFI